MTIDPRYFGEVTPPPRGTWEWWREPGAPGRKDDIDFGSEPPEYRKDLEEYHPESVIFYLIVIVIAVAAAVIFSAVS